MQVWTKWRLSADQLCMSIGTYVYWFNDSTAFFLPFHTGSYWIKVIRSHLGIWATVNSYVLEYVPILPLIYFVMSFGHSTRKLNTRWIYQRNSGLSHAHQHHSRIEKTISWYKPLKLWPLTYYSHLYCKIWSWTQIVLLTAWIKWVLLWMQWKLSVILFKIVPQRWFPTIVF